MRKRAVAALVAVAALIGIGFGSYALAHGGRSDQSGRDRALRLDAARLLARMTLPPGARRTSSTSKPFGDGGELDRPGSRFSGTVIDVHTSWTSSMPISEVERFFRSHPPAGAQALSRGYATDPAGATAFWTYNFAPLTAAHEQHPWDLAVNMLALSKGRTGIRIDGEVQESAPNH
jgi:hypothetical protein